MKRFHPLWKKFIKSACLYETIYNWLNREKHFLTQGVLLDEFLHILYELKVHHENFFVSLYVSQRYFEWCKIEQNETIFFLYLDRNFYSFQKKTVNLETFFFLAKGKFFNFDFEGMKSFWEDALNLEDICTYLQIIQRTSRSNRKAKMS